MKTLVLTCVLLTLSLQAGAADKGLTEEQMGLSKTPVTVDPDPATFEYRQADPYSGGVLPRAYSGAPPQVPHNLDGLIPITRDSNTCLSCHQQPDQVGKKKVKGQPTALPATHYTDVKKNALNMGRYNCTQCHAPQADVNNLVGNTFKRK
jgi:cytochrome c-type protein NapB